MATSVWCSSSETRKNPPTCRTMQSDRIPKPTLECGVGGFMGLYRYHVWCPGSGVRLERLPFWE
jgi:hypothetical protein